ncbi:MAG: response regulator [Algiphilus sp.]
MTTKVMLVDDHPIVRRGYRALLESVGGIAVVAEADTPRMAMRATRHCAIDVAVLDLRLPGTGGLRLCQRLRRYQPRLRVLIFSAQSDFVTVRAARAAGARAFLDKRAPAEALASAVLGVARGEPEIAHNAFAALQVAPRPLSEREQIIVRRLAAGEDTRDIAQALSISPKTVANHVYAARDKLQADSLAELIRYGVDHAAAPTGAWA